MTTVSSGHHSVERIAIIADRFLGWTGGRVYLENVLRSLRLIDDRPEVVVVCRSDKANMSALPLADQICTYDPHRLVMRFKRGMYDRLGLEEPLPDSELRAIQPNVLFGNVLTRKLSGMRLVSHVLDFQHTFSSHLYSQAAIRRRDQTIERVANNADLIMFHTEYVRDEFIKHHPEAASKTVVIPWVSVLSSDLLDADPSIVIQAYHLPDRYFLVANQWWHHKNHLLVLKTLNILKKRGTHAFVVFTGAPFEPREPAHVSQILQEISRLNLRDHVAVLGRISYEDVISLMRASMAVIQPSLYEGIGLSAAESRSLGKPILLSDLPVHRELNPPKAIFFNPHDPEELANLIDQNLESLRPGVDVDAERQALAETRDRGRQFARRFLTACYGA